MGVGNLLSVHRGWIRDTMKGVWKNPTRLITGVDPLSTKVWNKILNKDDKPLVNVAGGPTGETLDKHNASDGTRTWFKVADTVASIWGLGGAASAVGGAGAGAGAGAAETGAGAGAGAAEIGAGAAGSSSVPVFGSSVGGGSVSGGGSLASSFSAPFGTVAESGAASSAGASASTAGSTGTASWISRIGQIGNALKGMGGGGGGGRQMPQAEQLDSTYQGGSDMLNRLRASADRYNSATTGDAADGHQIQIYRGDGDQQYARLVGPEGNVVGERPLDTAAADDLAARLSRMEG